MEAPSPSLPSAPLRKVMLETTLEQFPVYNCVYVLARGRRISGLARRDGGRAAIIWVRASGDTALPHSCKRLELSSLSMQLVVEDHPREQDR